MMNLGKKLLILGKNIKIEENGQVLILIYLFLKVNFENKNPEVTFPDQISELLVEQITSCHIK